MRTFVVLVCFAVSLSTHAVADSSRFVANVDHGGDIGRAGYLAGFDVDRECNCGRTRYALFARGVFSSSLLSPEMFSQSSLSRTVAGGIVIATPSVAPSLVLARGYRAVFEEATLWKTMFSSKPDQPNQSRTRIPLLQTASSARMKLVASPTIMIAVGAKF